MGAAGEDGHDHEQPGADLPVASAPADVNSSDDDDTEQQHFLLNALDVSGDWSVHDDEQGHLFYYNCKTKQSRWEAPPGFNQGQLMMKLMLQSAIARSGFWTAHDAGNGTLYYFNERTRESVWERPEEWGVQPPPPPPLPPRKEKNIEEEKEGKEAQELDVDAKPKKEKKKKKKSKKTHEPELNRQEGAPKEVPALKQPEIAAQDASEPVENQEKPIEPTPEEIEESRQKEAVEKKRIEQFREMLREKQIMPLTKWSVAFPKIATDRRFVAVPTMEERRAIFEHFVKHRSNDLKAEKKRKMKQAKGVFADFLREYFIAQQSSGAWEAIKKTTLSIFLTTLEDQVDPAQYKKLQDDALNVLLLSVQEEIYAKTMAEVDEQFKASRTNQNPVVKPSRGSPIREETPEKKEKQESSDQHHDQVDGKHSHQDLQRHSNAAKREENKRPERRSRSPSYRHCSRTRWSSRDRKSRRPESRHRHHRSSSSSRSRSRSRSRSHRRRSRSSRESLRRRRSVSSSYSRSPSSSRLRSRSRTR